MYTALLSVSLCMYGKYSANVIYSGNNMPVTGASPTHNATMGGRLAGLGVVEDFD